eukprot:8913380-Pyramimonas_sp.AAC.1
MFTQERWTTERFGSRKSRGLSDNFIQVGEWGSMFRVRNGKRGCGNGKEGLEPREERGRGFVSPGASGEQFEL